MSTMGEPCLNCGKWIAPSKLYCAKCAEIPYPKPNDIARQERLVSSLTKELAAAQAKLLEMTAMLAARERKDRHE